MKKKKNKKKKNHLPDYVYKCRAVREFRRADAGHSSSLHYRKKKKTYTCILFIDFFFLYIYLTCARTTA